MRIVWTRHAQERQLEWEIKRAISREVVETLLRNPEQVAPGDRGTLIAQARHGGGLVRVVFTEDQEDRKILTLYWTSRVDRYWKETGDADPV